MVAFILQYFIMDIDLRPNFLKKAVTTGHCLVNTHKFFM